MRYLSCYFGHEAGMAVYDSETTQYHTFEFEKLTGKRYCRDINLDYADEVVIRWYLQRHYRGPRYKIDKLLIDTHLMSRPHLVWSKMLKGQYLSRVDPVKHHAAHASLGFWTSPFEKAVVITADGGGENESFTVSVAHNRKDPLQKLWAGNDNPNLGGFYLACAAFCKEVMYHGDYMTYAGKAMGLTARGKVRDEWYPELYKLARHNRYWGIATIKWPFRQKWYLNHFKSLIDVLPGIHVEGQDSYDLMATAQKVLQDIFIEIADPFIKQYPGYNIVISGGVALNVVNNEYVKHQYPDRLVFIPSAPGDSGLALGRLLADIRPAEQVKANYLGHTVVNEVPTKQDIINDPTLRGMFNMDKVAAEIMEYVTAYRSRLSDSSVPITVTEIAQMLADGKIIGVINGRSEFGPRALGARSILCDPSYPDMKDKINKKIKSREWYRPFAPVCRLQDAPTYFDSTQFEFMESMAFAPMVRPEWRDKLPSITHVDGTARLQTVTKESHAWTYNLLTEFDRLTGRQVLLNTSFNVKGKAILNDITDAVDVLGSTDLDALIYEDRMLVIYDII
tara:strand:- start:27694 stop:29385 length:1692 start_codon:yes stop_codon:yes gene_type:complete